MRVIAGKFKGRKLSFPQTKLTRPTSDMVKEGIFAKIFDKTVDGIFLDCFCGSGQMGIEALSRGAEYACFIDESFEAVKTTKENLATLKVENYKIIKANVIKALEKLDESFDIIFLDPPYNYQEYKLFFALVLKHNLLKEDGIVVCEHKKEKELSFEGFNKTAEKKYGYKSVSYFELI
jgi:16S rRNA (guanine(966)-N(2))-methyltransferase RsmD